MSGIGQHTETYTRYLASDEWRLRRHAALIRAGNACEECARPTDLTVHHTTYDRLGDERASDLVVLCPPCHERADNKRKADVADSRWSARVDSWATKRWGDDWHSRLEWHEAEEEFEEWLEYKGYA